MCACENFCMVFHRFIVSIYLLFPHVSHEDMLYMTLLRQLYSSKVIISKFFGLMNYGKRF